MTINSNTTMCHLILFALLLSSARLVFSASNFACSPDLPCYCDKTNETRVLCRTSNMASAFLLTIQTDSVQVQCINFPNWSDFLLGAMLDIGVIPNLKFNGCVMPGKNFSESVLKRLGISGVENVELKKNWGGISKADIDVFPNLKNLSFTDTAMGIGMGAVPVDLLYGLPKLQNLDLSGAGLHLRDDGFFRNSQSLVSLNIENNHLFYLPENIFYNLVNLQVIKFGFNRFSELPADLFSHNSRLKVVILRHNQYFNITQLPHGFLSGFHNLQNVSLEKIGLNKVPHNMLWGSDSILELNLSGNNLIALPIDFLKDARMLLKLDLSNNDFRILPDRVLSNLKLLLALDLSRNHFTVIDKNSFNNLYSLQELNLEHNNLKFIEYDALSSLVELKIAKFSHNQLDLYDREANGASPFYKCSRLEELYLSHNNITQIFGDWVIVLSQLRNLDLAYNSLYFLSTAHLEFASDEMQVNLTHNMISMIDLYYLEYEAAKYSGSRNVVVDLNFNPIYCDCDMYSFLRYIDGVMEQSALNFITLQVQQLTCDGPEHYKDLRLLDFIKTPELTCALESYNYDPSDPCENDVCDCYMRLSDRTLIMNCSSRNLIEAPENIVLGYANHVELDLSNNSLRVAPNLMRNGYDNVRSLNLAGNQIDYVDESLISMNLKDLKLSDNQLEFIDENILKKIINSNISLLTLNDNPWKCDCKSLAILNFVQQMDRFLPQEEIVCPSSKLSFSSMKTSAKILEIVLYMIIFSLVVISVISFARARKETKVQLYSRNLWLRKSVREKLDQDKLWDAFVAYSRQDENFVVQELINNLGSGTKIDTLCLYEKNLFSTEWIHRKICDGVGESKQTIIVLSSNFLNSDWSNAVFKAAHDKTMSDKCARLVIIVYGDVDLTKIPDPTMQCYFKTKSFIKWGEPSFYQKLQSALPTVPMVPKQIESSKIDSN